MAQTMKVGFYQSNPVFGDKEGNLQDALSAVNEADVDLIVLPELFASGYQFVSTEEVAELAEQVPDGRTTRALARLSRDKGLYIVAGLPERAGNTYYNSAVLTGPGGYIGLYRKTHLFFEEKLYFSPGDTGFCVWDTQFGRLGIMVCFDWFFPESMRTLALRGAEIVAHPANLVLPYCPQSMPMRCLENRVFAITANRVGQEERKLGERLTFVGQSMVVSPMASILAQAPEAEVSLSVVEINPALSQDKTINPYNDLFRDRRPEMYEGLQKKYLTRCKE